MRRLSGGFALGLFVLSACAQQWNPAVLTPDGKPAVGALAVMAPKGCNVTVYDGVRFDDNAGYQRSTADKDGKLHFTLAATRPSMVVVLHDSGYAQVKPPFGSTTIRLQPWCRIEGSILSGGNAGSPRTMEVINLIDYDPADPYAPYLLFKASSGVDDKGRYAFTRVPASAVAVYESTVYSPASQLKDRPIWRFTPNPSATSVVNFGGPGRDVVGRIVLPAELASQSDLLFRNCMIVPETPPHMPSPPDDVLHGPLSGQAAWWDAYLKSDAEKQAEQAREDEGHARERGMFGFTVGADATFRIPSVPPGRYGIDFQITRKVPAGQPYPRVAYGGVEFTVPELTGNGDQAEVQIPPMTTTLIPNAEVGDVAPPFTITDLAGKPVSLSDFRGKYVLLQFWAAADQTCIDALPEMQALYRRFGGDPRFVMISLDYDSFPAQLIHYVLDNNPPWTQCHIAPSDMFKFYSDYNFRHQFPSTWLIGPDGKVIAKDLASGDNTITAAVEKALGAERGK
jgi:cytochrome oxidase Cu insertion factor (SCO1/SenC/PrrC family)